MTPFSRFYLLVVVLTGPLLWLALPGGGGVWPLLFVALVPFFHHSLMMPWKTALLGAFLCGLSHYLLLLYWITIVVGKYGGLHWFIALQATLMLALYMSLYLVLFVGLSWPLLRFGPPLLGLLAAPALWVGLDWVRGVLFTGLPWMDLGYGLYRQVGLIQIADWVGHHGLTYGIVFGNIFIVLLLSRRFTVGGVVLFVVPAIAIGAAVFTYSANRLDGIRQGQNRPENARIQVGVVQGNIDQSIKWSPQLQRATVDKYLRLTRTLSPVSGRLDLVVWPETALPFYPRNNPLMQSLWLLVATEDIGLLTGAPWYEVIDLEKRKLQFFNSALMLKKDGGIGDRYYKSHLVPFGEYVPLKGFLPFLEPLVEAVGDFSPGTIEHPLRMGPARAGVLICFESVFPELSRRWVKAGANVLVNLTNDAWYGKSSAPHHSLAMAVLRAVETRRSVIRAANTGFSAFIGPDGAIVAESGLFVDWAGQAEVALSEEMTGFVRYGHLFAPICLVLGLIACATIAVWGKRTS